jgi:hypothetical protein
VVIWVRRVGCDVAGRATRPRVAGPLVQVRENLRRAERVPRIDHEAVRRRALAQHPQGPGIGEVLVVRGNDDRGGAAHRVLERVRRDWRMRIVHDDLRELPLEQPDEADGERVA